MSGRSAIGRSSRIASIEKPSLRAWRMKARRSMSDWAAACLIGVAQEKVALAVFPFAVGEVLPAGRAPRSARWAIWCQDGAAAGAGRRDPQGRDVGVVDESLRVGPAELDAIARLGGDTCATIRDRFEMATPPYNQWTRSNASD
jgi:hypothetical protein